MKILFATLCLLMCGISCLADNYRGTVYVDSNNNGVFDIGEKRLSQVMVSDGLNVVSTNNMGEFNLPGYEKTHFICITIPAGYKTSHFYQRVDNGASKKYNFGLQPNPATLMNKEISFIHITDTETSNYTSWIDDLKNYARNERVAFIMHTGDICREDGMSFHSKNITTKTMGMPMFYCIGNHDLVSGKYGEEYYENCFGPVCYSFDAGSVHFIVTPMMVDWYATPSYTPEDVLNWLRNDLAHVAKDKPIIVFNHDLWGNNGEYTYTAGKDSLDLLNWNLRAWIYGHWHINYVMQQGKKDVLAICSSTPDKGGIDHSPSSFRVIHVNEKGKVKIETRYTFNDKKISIVAPSAIQPVKNGLLPISVNVYNTTSPAVKVSYKISEGGKQGTWYQLKELTDWNWAGELPVKNFSLKEKDIEVEAVFASGETVSRTAKFRPSDMSAYNCKEGEPWPQLRGNAAHDQNIPDSSYSEPVLCWLNNTGGNIYMTSPIVVNKKVFTATIDDSEREKCGVFAFDAITGKRIWSFKTRNSVRNTIVYDSGKVFATDAEGFVYALDENTGKLIWEKNLGLNQLPAFVGGMAVENDVIYTGFGYGYRALKASDGNEIWRNKEWDENQGATSTITVSEKVVINSAHWSALYGNDKLTGKLLWTLNEKGLRFRDGSAVCHNDTLFLASERRLF
ncbi:MAG: PQQ-binding-like beta-propeller repeat protein, partial [Bacteroidota bacterium]|nr:PQQ-binding-like beta-propeller repeat protein [Bacteroidota bacterium]